MRIIEMDSLPLVRQMVVAVSPQLAALSVGGSIAYPTLLLEHFKSNSSFVVLDVHTSSWIGSLQGISGLPAIFMPMLMQWKGRKLGYIITCIVVMTGWILSLIANNLGLILASEAFHGLSTNSLLPVSVLSMTEMLAPRYRFISMQIVGLNITLGFAIVGIMGRFLHFKTVSAIMLVPSVIALVIGCFWPESPAWLAWKGEYHGCKQVFEWLRGTKDDARKELLELINAQQVNAKNIGEEKMTVRSFLKMIRRRDFYLPASHTFLLLNMMYWSGGEAILVYFLELAQRSTQSDNATFYGSIIMYFIIFLGSIITNVTVRIFKNKAVLLFSTAGVIFFLSCIACITYLQSIGVIAKDSLLCIYFLVGYVGFYALGLNSVVFYISAELMPVKHRASGGALYIACNCGLYASSLKLSPYLMLHADMCGTFLLYALNAAACALLVHRYVPETKGRTLTELEHYYNYGRFLEKCHDDDLEGTPMADLNSF